jgi:hypothetical protein
MKIISKISLALATLAFATAASAGQIYKQTDASGRVIFTDIPDPSARTVKTYESAGEAPRAVAAAAAPVLIATSGVTNSGFAAPAAPELAPWQEAALAANRGVRMNSLRSQQIDAREAARAGR